MPRKTNEEGRANPRMTMPVMPLDSVREAHLYHTAFMKAPVGAARVSLDGFFIETNPRLCEILRHDTPDTLVGTHFGDSICAEDRERSIEAAARLIRGEYERYSLEKRRLCGDGSPVWVRSTSSLLDDCRLCVIDEITEQKAQEEHDDLLIHELNHRVKNTLALVQSISQQTLRSVDTLDQFRERFQSRLLSLGRAQDILTSTDWEGATLSDIIGLTLAPYVANGSTIITAGDSVTLSANAAVLMNMIVHELATNATKYGSLSLPDGRLDIHWSYDDPVNPTCVRIVWQETGGPIVGLPTRRGFGSRVIEEGATRELGGKAQLCYMPSGLKCTLTIPISAKVRVGKLTSRSPRRRRDR